MIGAHGGIHGDCRKEERDKAQSNAAAVNASKSNVWGLWPWYGPGDRRHNEDTSEQGPPIYDGLHWHERRGSKQDWRGVKDDAGWHSATDTGDDSRRGGMNEQ
jgi:hypothetical protein